MAQVTLLGTGAAWSGPDRENTFMLVRGNSTNVLIDCGGGPTQRLAQVGVTPAEIDHIILTHNHPDHIYGFPLLLLNAWMEGRKAVINVYGLKDTIRSARDMLKALDFHLLPKFTPLKYHTIKPNSITPFPPTGEFEISGAPTKHFVPTLALRVKNRMTGESFAYSADTSPHRNVVELARGAKILLHEATMLTESKEGHSTALEAGEEAAKAHVGELILIHVPPDVQPKEWRAAAKKNFSGKVVVARDFDTFEF
jgi:ribonuclease Z